MFINRTRKYCSQSFSFGFYAFSDYRRTRGPDKRDGVQQRRREPQEFLPYQGDQSASSKHEQ